MEVLASLTLTVGLFFGPLCEIAQNYYISALAELLTGCLMCAFFYDAFFRLIPSGARMGQFRGIMGTGLCYIFLLPLAFLLSHDYKVSTQPEVVKVSLLLIFVPIISQLVFTAWYSSCTFDMRLLLCISVIPWLTLMVFGHTHYVRYMHTDVAAGMSVMQEDVVFIVSGLVVQHFLYRYASDSFSLQEGTIISQAVVLFAHQTWRPLFTALWNYSLTKDIGVMKHLVEFDIPKIELFSEVAVTSGIIVLCLIIFCKAFQNVFGFYGLTFVTMGLFSHPVLYLAYEKDFVTWMYGYVKATSERRKLFVLWAVVCVVSVITVVVTILCQGTKGNMEKLKIQQEDSGDTHKVNGDIGSKIQESSRNGYEMNLRNRCQGDHVFTKSKVNQSGNRSLHCSTITTVTRKIFHVIAVAAFLPGLHYDITILNTACSSALIIFTFLECMRILKVWPVGGILDQYLNMFRDRQDQGALILTPIYLLVGFSLPIWLHQPGMPNTTLFSGVLSLGIGDTAASYVGSKYGKRKWPHGSKTVEGTVASVVAMIMFGVLLHYSRISVTFNPVQLVIASVLMSLLEAFTKQIDNLILPLFMYCLLV